jgi:hypothetical protein
MHYQYYNSNTLLILSPKGQIRKLYTPFRVLSNENNSWLYVEEVRQGYNDQIIVSLR